MNIGRLAISNNVCIATFKMKDWNMNSDLVGVIALKCYVIN